METAVLAFVKQENLLYIKWLGIKNLLYMKSVRKSYIFQNLLKNTTLPAEMFGNMNLYQQKVLLNIIYDFRIEISFIEK